MIYINPPYNTGKDFIYPDNYADPLGQGRNSLRQDRLIAKQLLVDAAVPRLQVFALVTRGFRACRRVTQLSTLDHAPDPQHYWCLTTSGR